MRIIAGERRGCPIEPPKGADVTRPITDRVKENLFNIIQMQVPGSMVLDLYAGTGSLGLECLSRGAEWVTFVEQNLDTVNVLLRNIDKLKYPERCRVLRTNALRLRPTVRDSGQADGYYDIEFDLVFLDPPYKMIEDELMRSHIAGAMDGLAAMGALAADAMIVLRYPTRLQMSYPWGKLHLRRSRAYGSMTLDFLRYGPPPEVEVEPSDEELQA